MTHRIYVASSWRNTQQPAVVAALRAAGHAVYDFHQPAPGDTGFHWSALDGGWRSWDTARFRAALDHPIAQRGYATDWGAMAWADTGVLVLPCGRSAHLEAGYFVGAGKALYILLLDAQQPELMYRMATRLCLSVDELLGALKSPLPGTAARP